MSPTTPIKQESVEQDPDIVEQAKPGHGVPSQDPSPAAQYPLSTEEAEREKKSVYVGGGVMAGAASGAAVGGIVAGPVGIVVGGITGSVAGAVGAVAAGASAGRSDAEEEKVAQPHADGSSQRD